jgi:Polysaccharide deacetylase
MTDAALAAALQTGATQGVLSSTFGTVATAGHSPHRMLSKAAKGQVIGTGGKPVVAFRIDHGVQQWIDTVWPLFSARSMPAGVGIFTDAIDEGAANLIEPTTHTWAEIQTSHRAGWEVWAHSKTHRDPTQAGTTLLQETVTSADTIESHDMRVMGYSGPGISGNTTPLYSALWDGQWDAPWAQLCLGRFGLMELGGSLAGGYWRSIPTMGCYDLGHYTLDASTLAAAEAYLDTAIALGLSVEFMLHTKYVVEGSVAFTVANLTSLLDYVKTKWDADQVEVLTPSGLAFADPNTSARLNLIRDGSFAALTNWAPLSSAAIATDGGHTGPNYVTMPVAGGDITQTIPSPMLKTLSVQGTTCMIEAWIRGTGAGTTVARFIARDASNAAYLTETRTVIVTADNVWKRVRWPFTISPLTYTMSLEISRTGGGTATLNVDDVRIMPV